MYVNYNNWMNFSIKNVYNCPNLSDDKIKLLADKFNIKISNINKTNNKTKICEQIHKKANDINPCGLTLHTDTDLILKKYQLTVCNNLMNKRGLIVVHSVGTGKTLTAISTAQCLLLKNLIEHIIVITPTSLQKNFILQAKMYGLSDTQINKYYSFYTIQGIVNAIENLKVINPSKSLIIIDESHNLRTLDGNRFNIINKYSKKAVKILLLTATPLINYPSDIINLIALINGEDPLSIDDFEKIINYKNKTEFKNYVNGLFNFYIKDPNDINFPKKKILEIFLPMKDSFLKIYEKIEKGQVDSIIDFRDKNINVFYNGLRRASNIIENKSPKVEWIKDKISSEPNSRYLIFSHFINMGIIPIIEWLKKMKYSFGYITGNLNMEQRAKTVMQYNNDEIKILFISSAGSEGLDLKNIKYIIIMEPSWNENLIEQIIGRGVRYKSHESLPLLKRNVTVYRLYCVKPIEYENIKKIVSNSLLKYNDLMISVDLYLRNYSLLKQRKLDKFQKELIKYSN